MKTSLFWLTENIPISVCMKPGSLAHTKKVTFRLEAGKWIISHHLFPSFGLVHAATFVIHPDELYASPVVKVPPMLEKRMFQRGSNTSVAPCFLPFLFCRMWWPVHPEPPTNTHSGLILSDLSEFNCRKLWDKQTSCYSKATLCQTPVLDLGNFGDDLQWEVWNWLIVTAYVARIRSSKFKSRDLL